MRNKTLRYYFYLVSMHDIHVLIIRFDYSDIDNKSNCIYIHLFTRTCYDANH